MQERGTGSLKCVFSGYPQPTVTWTKDGEIVRNGQNEYNSVFEIRDATISDGGVYICEGVNREGTGSATYTLTVEPTTIPTTVSTTTRASGGGNIKGTREPPTTPPMTLKTEIYMVQPRYYAGTPNLVAYAPRGSRVQLYCHVIINIEHQNAEYTVNWFLRGTRIHSGGTFDEPYFDTNDAGRYTCTAYSNSLAHSSSMEIRVGSPLRITRSPASRYYSLREAISLRVEVNRRSDYEVNWYRVNVNGSLLLIREGNGVFFQSNKKRLDINPLVVGYLGAYRVRIVSQGEVSSADFSVNANAAITTQQPSGTTPFVEGGTIILPCIYYGYPTPVVKWYLNGRELDPSNSNKYNLSRANVLRVGPLGENDDKNRIECRIRQNNQRHEVEYNLELGESPEIITTNCDATLCTSSNVKLVCNAGYDQSITYKWYKSTDTSTSIRPSSKYSVYSHGRLDILRPNSNDIGTYICEARNKYGSDYIRCGVLQPTALNLVSSEQDVIITLGRDVNIYCKTNQSLGATVSWYKDNNRLLPNDVSINTIQFGQTILTILSLKNVAIQHGGEYTCSVTRCDDEVKQTHQLRVRQDVNITQTPDETYFCSGKTVCFRCEAIGYPQPVISWYINGSIITNGENGYYINGRDDLCVIGGPASKTGTYKCNASNPFSWEIYRSWVVFADVSLATFSEDELELPILNQDYYLDCLPTVSDVEYSYKWYKQTTLLLHSEKYDQSNEWQLRISNFNQQDLRRYMCTVTNCKGTSKKVFDINSYQGQDAAPSISTTRTQYRVIQSRTVRLLCAATGSPRPSISWYYKGELVSEEGDFSLTELPNLRINNVQRDLHDGNYECAARNNVGTASLSIELIILQPPKLAPLRSQRIDIGLTACFSCSLTQGDPPPERVWTKDGIEIVSEGEVSIDPNTYRLCITNARGDSAGVYRCTAKSDLGWAYVEATLQVRTCGKLRFTETQLKHTVGDGSSLTINCPVEPNVFECSVLFYWNELTLRTNATLQKIPSSDPRLSGYSLVLQLDMDGTGYYQCVAQNQESVIAQNHAVTVVAAPRVVPFVKQQIFRINSEVSLNCPIRGISPITYIWQLGGSELASGGSLIINNDQLTINNASASNTGQYFCTGSNLYGQREAMIDVTICGPMTLEFTEDHEVEEKARTTFTCHLQGQIIANSIEFLVGENRSTVAELPAKRFAYNRLEPNTAELRIATRVEDTGPVTCRVNTICGVSETTHLLTVRPKTNGLRVVRNQITHPGTVPPNCHNQFTLKCPVRGKPKPAYAWFHNDIKIVFRNNAHVVSGRGKKEITVHDPDINDAGNYRCDATNNQGRVSFTYNISVQLPRVSTTYQEHTAFEGENLNLACNPEVLANRKWSKDLVRLSSEANPGVTNDWVISGVQGSDEGTYLCCAKSGDTIYRYIHEVQVQE